MIFVTLTGSFRQQRAAILNCTASACCAAGGLPSSEK
jgi:hypothetical protein